MSALYFRRSSTMPVLPLAATSIMTVSSTYYIEKRGVHDEVAGKNKDIL
jgi:hypothetical protein